MVMLLPGLTACWKKESIPVGIVGYNHTDVTIVQFLINDGNGDSALRPHQGGGSTSCCAMIPRHWRPAMTVEISWTTDLRAYHKRVIPILKYDEVGDLAVHFLRNGEIKVFVTNVRLGHPDYPLTGPEAALRAGEDPIRDDWRTDGKGAKK
nr:DUF3304 domain-containing protein [Stenotrophomonas sp. MMGLT7]